MKTQSEIDKISPILSISQISQQYRIEISILYRF